jgi:Fe2+ or Zn2+ uptake regulation protein
MRNTHQRDAILAYLRSERAHRSASEVYDAVRKEIPNISLGTVYRNLGQLVELGKIITVETQDKFVYYDGYVSPHTHFVCRGCKGIFDFEIKVDYPKEITGGGFEIETERTVYYGLCKNCKK